MSVAKVIRLRVDIDKASQLQHALERARERFLTEAGTMAWEVYDSEQAEHRGLAAGERVLVEMFSDDAAVREHDASDAVAELLAEFESLEVKVLSAAQYSLTRSTQTAPSTDKEQ